MVDLLLSAAPGVAPRARPKAVSGALPAATSAINRKPETNYGR